MLWVAITAYLLTLGWFTGVNLFLTGWKELGWSDLFVWVICSVLLWMSLNFRLWTASHHHHKFKSIYSRAVKCAWFEDQKRK